MTFENCTYTLTCTQVDVFHLTNENNPNFEPKLKISIIQSEDLQNACV